MTVIVGVVPASVRVLPVKVQFPAVAGAASPKATFPIVKGAVSVTVSVVAGMSLVKFAVNPLPSATTPEAQGVVLETFQLALIVLFQVPSRARALSVSENARPNERTRSDRDFVFRIANRMDRPPEGNVWEIFTTVPI